MKKYLFNLTLRLEGENLKPSLSQLKQLKTLDKLINEFDNLNTIYSDKSNNEVARYYALEKKINKWNKAQEGVKLEIVFDFDYYDSPRALDLSKIYNVHLEGFYSPWNE